LGGKSETKEGELSLGSGRAAVLTNDAEKKRLK